MRRSSACSIPIADGKEAEDILGAAASLHSQGRGHQRLPSKPRAASRRGNGGAARPACHGESCLACSPRPCGPWRASGSRVSEPGGLVAQGSGRPARPLRVQPRPRRAGKAGVDRRPHARPCSKRARRDGLKEASLMVSAPSSSSEMGSTHDRATGGRWTTLARHRVREAPRPAPSGWRPRESCLRSQDSRAVWRGTGRKGSNDLARGLLYLRSRFRQQLRPGVRPPRENRKFCQNSMGDTVSS